MQSLVSKFIAIFRRSTDKEESIKTEHSPKNSLSSSTFVKEQQPTKLPTKGHEMGSSYLQAVEKVRLQLMPTIVDNHATNNPEKVFASIPFNNDDLSQGFRDITYLDFRRAIDKAAYWLEDNTRIPEPKKFPTFAFYGGRDLRYCIFAVAAMKTGYKMLSPSLFCAMDAHAHLVKESDCQNLLCIPSTLPLAEAIIKQLGATSSSNISTTIVPELADLLPVGDKSEIVDKYYPYKKSWDEACNDPCLIVHTSGSTGMPKMMYYTQRMLAHPLYASLLPPLRGQATSTGSMIGRTWTTVPPFHLAGYGGFFVLPIYLGSVAVMAPPDRPMDTNLAHEMHLYARLDGGIYHPSLLQDVVRDEHKRQELGKLKRIYYGGSPLETTTGQWIASNYGNLQNVLGSTESFGYPTAAVLDPAHDWMYINFYPIDGLHFEPVGLANKKGKNNNADDNDGDELYELIIRRTPEVMALTNVFLSLPQLTEWSTKDLWQPHPDPAKKGHWLYCGRTDDLVVLSGEIKMYAASLEDKITSAHPLIRTTLVGGNQRKWPVLLLELADSPATAVATGSNTSTATASSATLDEIWSHLDEINTRYTHGSVRLHRSLVIVADKNRPFVRLAKGSVARNPTFELYKQDIDKLYADMEK